MKARRLASTLAVDARLQLRHGFYVVYLVVTALYVLVLRGLPDAIGTTILPLIVFSDPAIVGFFFVGAIILLERNDRILDGLFVAPLEPSEYILGKVASLTSIGLVVSVAVALGVRGLDWSVPWLLIGVGLSGTLFTLVGVAIAARIRSTMAYFGVAGLVMAVACIPWIDHFGLVSLPILDILPTGAALGLIEAAFAPAPWQDLAFGVSHLVMWIGVAYLVADRWLARYVLGHVGDAP